MRPEDYGEMTAYLNTLASWVWNRMLRAKEKAGNAGVLINLRTFCGKHLTLWTDQELLEYLQRNDITNEEEFPRDGRL